MKKTFSITTIIVLVYIIIHININEEFKIYVSILFLASILGVTIPKFLKPRKEDEINGTEIFTKSLVSMAVIICILLVYYLYTAK